MKINKNTYSLPSARRQFLKGSAGAALTGLTAPWIIPAAVLGGPSAPSNRLNIAMIGCGLISRSHRGRLAGRTDVQVRAVCDVWDKQRNDARAFFEQRYAQRQDLAAGYRGVDTHAYYEEVLQRDDIDVVFVTTPDHWHAPIANAAMKAGKDVYCEKPLTLTVREGRTLVETARRYGRVLQTGSQQRSEGAFRKAAEIVRNGLIGEVTRIKAGLGAFPAAPLLSEQAIPAGLDYDRWLGSTPWRPFHINRIKGNYGGGWRCFLEYGGRKNGDWGAHHFDIIQWALGMDESGPVRFIPKGYQGKANQTHIYGNGVTVERTRPSQGMIEFTGTEGSVWVARGNFLQTNPAQLATQPLPAGGTPLYTSPGHHDDFFRAVRHRTRAQCDVEVGHRSATVCHLNTIASILGRPVHWDPATESVVGDEEASRMLDRPRRAPYAL